MTGEKSLEELKSQLSGWKTRIESLDQQASAVKPEMQATYMDRVEDLKQKVQTLYLFVQQLEKEKGSARDKVRSDFEKIMTDLDEGYRKALVYFP